MSSFFDLSTKIHVQTNTFEKVKHHSPTTNGFKKVWKNQVIKTEIKNDCFTFENHFRSASERKISFYQMTFFSLTELKRMTENNNCT